MRIVSIVLILLIFSPALAAAQGPSVGVTARDQEQSATRRGIDRSKEMETRRGRTSNERQGAEARKTTERSKATSTSQESRESRDRNRSREVNIDLATLAVRLLSRVEHDPHFPGAVGFILRKKQVFSNPKMPVLEPYMTHNPGGDLGKFQNYYPNWVRPEPDLPVQSGYFNLAGFGLAWRRQPVGLKLDGSPPFFRYPQNGPNSAELYDFSMAYILSAILLRDALDHMACGKSVIALAADIPPEQAIYTAMLDVASMSCDVLVSEAIRVTIDALQHGCDVPTTTGFAGGQDSLRCGGLVIRPREHQISLAGLSLLGQQIFGRSYTARLTESKSIAKTASESTTSDRRSSSSQAHFSANEQSREDSSSSSMRRSRSIGSSSDSSSVSDTQSGVSVSPN